MKNQRFKGVFFYLILIAVLVVCVVMFQQGTEPEKVTYSDILGYFETEQVKSFVVEDGVLSMTMRDDTLLQYRLPSLDLFVLDTSEIIEQQRRSGVIESYDYIINQVSWFVSLIPYLIMFAILIGLWIFMMNRAGGGAKSMQFGKSKLRNVNDAGGKKTFADVAGLKEEKAELEEIVDYLKNPKKYVEIGARIPKGVLLVGSPGTGKTLLAKAVAGEAGVPFFSISGSDFVEMFVGVGASRVRDMFDQAKKNLPSILFIDEIDAVGRRRGAGLGGGHDEREQTLNQLLVEMDGFGNNEGVIVIAATNRPDILDPALLRPGRFDRQIVVGYPDIKGREEILRVHARGKPFDDTVDLETIAKTSAGFTGADLENVLNESALLAARRGADKISQIDIDEATRKVILGPEKKSRVISEKEKKLTAYHEAGHAIVTKFMPTAEPVHEISIIPRGRSGGYTMNLPTEDKYYSSRNEMIEEIVVLLGGRAAETVALEDISTGASNDIERATAIAKKMVMKYGMSDRLGPMMFGSESEEVFLGRDFVSSHNFSEKFSSEIDDEIKRMIDEAFERAKAVLLDNMDTLHKVAEYLFKNEKMMGDVFYSFFSSAAAES